MLTQKNFEKLDPQKQINACAKKYKNKKIILYGAGIFAAELINQYNLSNLNIIGIADKKFAKDKPETYLNIKAYTPDELKNVDYDVLFLSVLDPQYLLNQMKGSKIIQKKRTRIFYLKDNLNLSDKILKLIKPKKSDENCMICSYSKMNTYPAQIAPFLVDFMFDFKEKETELLYCPRCEISYFKLRPNEEQISKYYSSYASGEYAKCRAKYEPHLYEETASFTNPNATPDFRQTEMKKNLSKINKKIKSFNKVLDYGGYGELIPEFFNHTEKFAYDISIDVDPEKPNLFNDLNQLEKDSFDFIISTHVLEHLSDPRQCVEEMATFIKKGGYIYIELPDETGLVNDVSTNFFKTFGDEKVFQMHEHINVFKPKPIKYLLEDLGFEVLDSKFQRCDFFYGYRGYMWCLARKK